MMSNLALVETARILHRRDIRAFALARLEAAIRGAFTSAGVSIEQSTSYHVDNIMSWAQAEAVLKQDPFGGHLFVFRGRRGDLVKVIWWDGQGACMFMKRLEKGRFVWPAAKEGKVALSPAQLSMLLEGIDWRAPERTWRPLAAG